MCWISALLYILVAIPQSYSSFLEGQVRNEALRYLSSVGQRYLDNGDRNSCPIEYMNDPATGWTALDKLVKEVVGVVCGDYPYDGERGSKVIKTGCKLFEWITAHYLAFISVSEAFPVKPLPQCAVRYPNTDYSGNEAVTLARVRDLIPFVCEKLNDPLPAIFNFRRTKDIVNARDGCRKLNDIATDYLYVLQFYKGGPDVQTYRHIFHDTPNRPNLTVTYEQVIQSLPIVCEGNVSGLIVQSCSFFHTITRDLFSNISRVLTLLDSTSNNELDPYDAVLKVETKPRGKMFPFHHAKAFFIDYCRKKEISQMEKLTCRYLLIQHLELLVNDRENVLERRG